MSLDRLALFVVLTKSIVYIARILRYTLALGRRKALWRHRQAVCCAPSSTATLLFAEAVVLRVGLQEKWMRLDG